MKVITIKRLSDIKDQGNFGVLFHERDPICVTLERNWKNNQINESCVPEGEYLTERILWPLHGEVFRLLNTAPRTDVLIHKGNFITETKGCIILGSYYEKTQDGKVFVADSGLAFDHFMRLFKGENQFKLVIQNVPWI